MGIIWMIVVGLVAGLIARAIMPGKDSMGWVMTIVLGIVGSFVGGFLMNVVMHNDAVGTSDFQPSGIIGSVIGALVVLGIWHLVRRRTAVAGR
jgi:uncharacterized membrane protein YeaQ/YmgE (transglycosylase-associated protein family)